MSFTTKIPPHTALIFMKGHSERVPGKNLNALCGRPLCHWILETLASSQAITQIIVNTDSAEIAGSVHRLPKVKIHERPKHLLGDHVGASPILEWDLAHCEGEHFVQSHSTNPLLTCATLENGMAAFFSQRDHDSLFSVTEIRRRFYTADGHGLNHDPAHLLRTQDLKPIYEENSCFYLFSRSSFKATGQRLGRRPMMFAIPALEAIDIDEPHDFVIAQALAALRQQ